jgi:hypothetical protein
MDESILSILPFERIFLVPLQPRKNALRIGDSDSTLRLSE